MYRIIMLLVFVICNIYCLLNTVYFMPNLCFKLCIMRCLNLFKVRKTAKIRKRYNQVPHLTQDTTWESNKNTINITNKSQEASPFSAGDHKAAMNRRESMRNTRNKKTQMIHKRNTPMERSVKLFYSRALVHMWMKTHRCLVCMKDP